MCPKVKTILNRHAQGMSCPPETPLPCPPSLLTGNYLCCLTDLVLSPLLSYTKCSTRQKLIYISAFFPPLNKISQKSLPINSQRSDSSLFFHSYLELHYVHSSYFIRPISMTGHVSGITVVNQVALNNLMHVYFHLGAVLSGSIPRNRILGLKGKYKCSFVRYCQALLCGAVQFCIPTAIEEGVFHRSSDNRVYSQAFEFLPNS